MIEALFSEHKYSRLYPYRGFTGRGVKYMCYPTNSQATPLLRFSSNKDSVYTPLSDMSSIGEELSTAKPMQEEFVDVISVNEGQGEEWQYEGLHYNSCNLSYSRGGAIFHDRKTMYSALRESSQHLSFAKLAIQSKALGITKTGDKYANKNHGNSNINNNNNNNKNNNNNENAIVLNFSAIDADPQLTSSTVNSTTPTTSSTATTTTANNNDNTNNITDTTNNNVDNNTLDDTIYADDVQSSSDEIEMDTTEAAEQWTPIQHSLFTRVNYCLQELYLQRIATKEFPLEPVIRKLDTDQATEKVRDILTRYEWNERLTSWLHEYFLELLDKNILPIYLDILQVLYAKCPILTRSMIKNTIIREEGDGLRFLISRPWDPAIGGIQPLDCTTAKFNPLPSFIIIPSCSFGGIARWKMWRTQLKRIGRVFQCKLSKKLFINRPGMVNFEQVAKKMIKSVYLKIHKVQKKLPDTPIILVGWGAAGLIGARLLQLPSITSLICLDYQTRGHFLKQLPSEDPLYQTIKPVMVVAPTNSHLSSEHYLLELRRNAFNLFELCLVGGVGPALLAAHSDLYKRMTTQSAIDRAILRSIQEFLMCFLVVNYQKPYQLVSGSLSEQDPQNLSPLKHTSLMSFLKFCKSRSLPPAKKYKDSQLPTYYKRSISSIQKSDNSATLDSSTSPVQAAPPNPKRPRINSNTHSSTTGTDTKNKKTPTGTHPSKASVVSVIKIPDSVIKKLNPHEVEGKYRHKSSSSQHSSSHGSRHSSHPHKSRSLNVPRLKSSSESEGDRTGAFKINSSYPVFSPPHSSIPQKFGGKGIKFRDHKDNSNKST